MSQVNEGDFVELEYTGRIGESGFVFDTTSEEVAKSSGINGQGASYGPVIVCIGAGQLLRGLEKFLVGKSPGKYSVSVPPEDGFGKKNAKLLNLVPTSKFREQGIIPAPGLQVNIDGMFGIVKSVSGGRTVVDFNHPLAGKELNYDVNLRRIVADARERLDALLKFYFREFTSEIVEGIATVSMKSALPAQFQDRLKEDILKHIPDLKQVEFAVSA